MTTTDTTYSYCDEWFVMVLRAPAAVGKSKISSPFFVWMIFCARVAARLHMSYRGHFMGHVCLTMFTPVVLILEMVHVSVQHVDIYALAINLCIRIYLRVVMCYD